MDLSFPKGASVNFGVDKTMYLGEEFRLQLPGPTALRDELAGQGEKYLWSVDVKRAYRQLRSDPQDLPLLCFNWDQAVYIDTAVVFGL